MENVNKKINFFQYFVKKSSLTVKVKKGIDNRQFL